MRQIAGVDSNKFKVLIVDDIPLNLILLDKMLKPYEFQIVKANNGQDALTAVSERVNTPDAFDLAIVDLMMPGIDGYQVIEYLRQGYQEGGCNIPPLSQDDLPIVVLSSMNFSDDISRAMALGANQYLTKPVIMEQLYNAVTQQLTKKAEAMA